MQQKTSIHVNILKLRGKEKSEGGYHRGKKKLRNTLRLAYEKGPTIWQCMKKLAVGLHPEKGGGMNSKE